MVLVFFFESRSKTATAGSMETTLCNMDDTSLRSAATTTPSTTTTSAAALVDGLLSPTIPPPLDGLEDVTVQPLRSPRAFRNAIDVIFRQWEGGSHEEYLIFSGVDRELLEKIDALHIRCARLEHHPDGRLLVVKVMPSTVHETLHVILNREIMFKARDMGLGQELKPVGGSRYNGRYSAKEADSALKPKSLRRGKDAWPTIVIEAGVSERLMRLRTDARWWLSNSDGEVKIVVILCFYRNTRTILVEVWQMRPTQREIRTRVIMTDVPTRTQSIELGAGVVTGMLTIPFEDVMLRDAAGPHEQDFVFTAQELAGFYAEVWEEA